MTMLRNLWNDEQGQDLIEYTLLMAFVALASAALFLGAGGSIKGIWTTSNSQLAAANTQASCGFRRVGGTGVFVSGVAPGRGAEPTSSAHGLRVFAGDAPDGRQRGSRGSAA